MICRAESPGLEQFARTHEDKLRVIGLGAQDDLESARDFVADGGITFTMLWDESFESWIQLGVRGQPMAILFDADGTPLGTWSGFLDEGQILDLIEA